MPPTQLNCQITELTFLTFPEEVRSYLTKYWKFLKTGSLDNEIREFSLAKPSWYMSHYTMIHKNGERMCDFLGFFVLIVV